MDDQFVVWLFFLSCFLYFRDAIKKQLSHGKVSRWWSLFPLFISIVSAIWFLVFKWAFYLLVKRRKESGKSLQHGNLNYFSVLLVFHFFCVSLLSSLLKIRFIWFYCVLSRQIAFWLAQVKWRHQWQFHSSDSVIISWGRGGGGGEISSR